MTKRVLFFLMILSVSWGCSSQKQQNNEEKGSTQMDQNEEKFSFFGEKITAQGAITYDEMIGQLEGKDSLMVKVEGKVEAVCQAKGCWMNIVSTQEEDLQPTMVKFKDYGFFVPKDIAGQSVIMEGKAYREVTSVDELRHYAEDAGKSKEEIEKIVEPKIETKFMATGVIVVAE